MSIFHYTSIQTDYLAQRDEKLGRFIRSVGHIRRELAEDFFSGLCYNIVNQQLSMKACNTLWAKLTAQLGEITPQTASDCRKLRACGLSQSKADCIARCAKLFLSGEMSAGISAEMTDSELIAALTRIKGIGEWTAEMTLIFCLGRENVLSLSDFGIRKGLALMHGLDPADIKSLKKFKQLYSPYGTTASLYLWEYAATKRSNEHAEKNS